MNKSGTFVNVQSALNTAQIFDLRAIDDISDKSQTASSIGLDTEEKPLYGILQWPGTYRQTWSPDP